MTATLASTLDHGPGWPSGPPTSGPLAGIRVLDLSRVLAGPYCCMVLADLGADVLKVERPGRGDDTRSWGPPFHGADATYFLAVNRDRRSLTLDLASPAGRLVVARLAGTADVVVENFLPRHLEALGLARLQAETDAVWVSVRGAGGDGPDGQLPGYDVMAQARGGLMSVTGITAPTKVGVAVADVITGLYAAVGAVAGLVARRPTRIEVGLLEATVATLVNQASAAFNGGDVPGPAGNEHPSIVPYGPVRCADRDLVIGAGNDTQFAALCDVAGVAVRPEWATNAGRVADRPRLSAALAAAFGSRSAAHWVAALGARGVPCAPVQGLADLPSDPQLVACGLIQELAHPAGPVRLVGSPLRVDGSRPRIRRAPPTLGQDTTDVLAALGLTAEQIAGLADADRR